MPTLSFHQLEKHYGPVRALDGFTASVLPGRITAFLGANGAGKTTSMRIMLGLSEPTSGAATIDGQRYADLQHPLRTVGAVLDQGFTEPLGSEPPAPHRDAGHDAVCARRSPACLRRAR